MQERVVQERVEQERVVPNREARVRIVEEQAVCPGRATPQVGHRGAKATSPVAIAGRPDQGVPPAEPVLRVPPRALATATIGAERPAAAGVRQLVGARPVAIPGPTPGRNAPNAAPAPAPLIVRIVVRVPSALNALNALIVVRVPSALTGRLIAASVASDPIGGRAVGGRPVVIACRLGGPDRR